MKLRNKKTGEIWGIPRMRHPTVQEDDISFFAMLGTNGVLFSYRSIAELNEEWEDYTPKEPLIKDEKIREAVRAWAEASYLRGAIFDFDDGTMMLRGVKSRASISFDGLDFCEFNHITAGYHTIAELCGEGEAPEPLEPTFVDLDERIKEKEGEC